MRYAALSDIHGNLEALTAVLDWLATQRIDRYLCLGDVVGYGADPGPCLTRLQALDAVTVAGNHDYACIGKLEIGWFHDAARAAVLWTRDQLSIAELDALRRLPLTQTVDGLTLAHAGLRHPQRFAYLMDLGHIVDCLATCRTLFCLTGHTHLPVFVEYDRAGRRSPRVLTRAEDLARVRFTNDAEAFRYFVNPGSVGQPRDGDPRASTAIVDLAAGEVSFHRVAYPVAAAQEKIRRAGLPPLLAERLAVGR